MKLGLSGRACALGILSLAWVSTSYPATLEECIGWGLVRNPSIRKIELERSLDRPGKQAAIGQFLPSISVGFGISQSSFYNPTYINADGRVATFPKTELIFDTYIDSLGYIRGDTTSIRNTVIPIPEGKRSGSTSYVRIDETLYDGGKNYYDYKNALLSLEVRDARADDAKRLVRSSITHAYAIAILADRQLELANRMTTQRRMQLEFAKARLVAGSVTRRDVLQAEVELGRAVSDSLKASLAIKRANEELNLRIGLPLDTTFSLAGITQPEMPQFSILELEQLALDKRRDAVVVEKTLIQRENQVKGEKSRYLPQLTAGLTHDRSERSGTSEAFTLNPRNKNTTVDLTLNWLVFDRFTRELNVQQRKVDQSKLEIEFVELKLNIRREVRQAFETLQSAYLQVEVASANAILAAQTLEFEQERYRLGSATLIELNAAQLSYYQAQTEKIKQESEYMTAYGDLEAAVGQSFAGK